MRDLSLFVTVTLIWWQEQVMVRFEVGWRVLDKHQRLPIKCELWAFSSYWVCYLLTNGNELHYDALLKRFLGCEFPESVSNQLLTCGGIWNRLWNRETHNKVVAVGKSITLTNLKIHNTINLRNIVYLYHGRHIKRISVSKLLRYTQYM